MKLKYRSMAFIMAVLLLINTAPILGAESTTVNARIADYMNARTMALVFGEADVLEEYSVVGIVADESVHYEALKAKDINIVASTYEIISTVGDEIEVEVELEETIYYYQDWELSSELIQHTVSLIYNENDVPIVVSDSYYEEYSEFVSASYVNPYAEVLADAAGSDECIVRIAGTQVGYLEKETNASLDSFTANAGDGNYTKYGKWYGWNGVVWCAIFVSWCADQANVSTSIIPKTADCDTSMNFFKNAGGFHASKAYGGSYTPQVGDIFFTGPEAVNATHTGIVVAVGSSSFTAVHGNSSDQNVKKSTCSFKNTSLLGYGTPAYGNSTHSYEYSSTSTGHTGTCSVCGYTTAVTAHNIPYSYNATSHSGYCKDCGYFVSPTNHTHTYQANSAGHWSECSVCGFTYGSSVVAHTFTWKYDSTNHWKLCSVCGYKTTEEEHTWQAMGAYTKCIYCGKYKE